MLMSGMIKKKTGHVVENDKHVGEVREGGRKAAEKVIFRQN